MWSCNCCTESTAVERNRKVVVAQTKPFRNSNFQPSGAHSGAVTKTWPFYSNNNSYLSKSAVVAPPGAVIITLTAGGPLSLLQIALAWEPPECFVLGAHARRRIIAGGECARPSLAVSPPCWHFIFGFP